MSPLSSDYRKFFEELLDELHSEGYNVSKDTEDEKGLRIVQFEKYQVIVTIIQTDRGIDFDIYGNLKTGIYEIGDLHLITRKMLTAKKICLKYNGREMNTTERLYPENRQGKETQTSGL